MPPNETKASPRNMKVEESKTTRLVHDRRAEPIFLVRNVTSDFVARGKEEFYRRGRRLIDYHIDNVSEKYRESE
jgi:hypothetical protein